MKERDEEKTNRKQVSSEIIKCAFYAFFSLGKRLANLARHLFVLCVLYNSLPYPLPSFLWQAVGIGQTWKR